MNINTFYNNAIPLTSEIALKPLSMVMGICPIADKFNQFDISNLLKGILIQDVKSLTTQAAKTSYDNYYKLNGEGFRYGIKEELFCERREWFGNGDSQFDQITTADNGFELKRKFDIIKGRLEIKCTVNKVNLHCSAMGYFEEFLTSYEAVENQNSIHEKLCINNECEELNSPKKKTPPMLNKLMHITDFAAKSASCDNDEPSADESSWF
ncbi:MAG TPA: hypothetical protein VGP47_02505 [Parachlamydiaceae bacterium]|nr:hypothetical protein [Parachlamydiaceae bacterium]